MGKESQETQFEQIIGSIAENGYGVFDNFLDEIEVENLRITFESKYKLGFFKQANIGKKTEEKAEISIRGDQILWLNQATSDLAEQSFFHKIASFSKYLNQTCYLGITDSEFHYAKYPIGKFYRRHRDSFLTKKGRILSVIIYLNTQWKAEDGGQLIIYKSVNGLDNQIVISPIAGRIVCFESEKLDHEVVETFAERLSLTGWLLNG